MNSRLSHRLLAPLLVMFNLSLPVAFYSDAYAQTNSTVEIGAGTLDHNEMEGPRWEVHYFDPLASGLHTIRIVSDGDADIRFSLFNANTESILHRNLTEQWIGELDSSESYFLRIWSAAGVSDFAATIEAETTDEFPELAITSQPADLTVSEGGTAIFTAEATGRDPLSYQWLVVKTETDPATGDLIIHPAEPIEGATSAVLSISPVSIADNDSIFSVAVTDSNAQMITSDNAILVVEAAEEPVSEEPPPTDNTGTMANIGEATLDSERNAGSRWIQYEFDSLGEALHTITVSWDSDADVRFNIFDSSNERLNSTGVKGTNPGVWSSVLNADERYRLSIWSAEGIANFTATVEASVPLSITSQPSDISANAGSEVAFTVIAAGSGTLSYQWFVDGIAIDGAIGPELLIDSVVNEENATQYSVRVANGTDTILSESAVLTVIPDDEPVDVDPGTDDGASEDDPITLVNLGQGTLDSNKNVGPKFIRINFDSLAAALHTITVSWDSDADVRFNVFDSTDSRLNSSIVQGANPGVWSGELAEDEQYTLLLWSFDGIANFSANVEATVPLAITSQPADLVVVEGENAIFFVETEGSGNVNYQWYLDGVAIDGETSDTLIVPSASLADSSDNYTVEVSYDADAGIVSDSAQLIVLEPVSSGRYSQEPDTSTWVLNGPAPTLDFNVSSETAAWGRVLLRIDSVLLVGGDFNGIRPAINGALTERPWLAALDAITGEPVTTFQVPLEVDSVVRALALSPDGDRVYVGGDFGLLALDSLTGELDFSLDVNQGNNRGRVFDIAVTQTQLYIGGDFTSVNNSTYRNLARLSLDGELDPTWKPVVSGGTRTGRESPVQSVTVSPAGNTIYVGGNFSGINNIDVELTIRGRGIPLLTLDANDGSIVRPERFIPDVSINKPLRVRDMAVTDNYVIIAWGGPNFMTFHSLDGTRLVQYEATGDVQALKVVGDTLFVGHHGEFFGSMENPVPPEAVESIVPEIVIPYKLHSFRIDDPAFPSVQAWQLRGFFGIWGISAADDGLWVSGQITAAGPGDEEMNGLVRFPASRD